MATASLAEAQNKGRGLETTLAAEQAKVSALQEDKQQLMSGSTMAREELARI